ncbi:MAG: flagellin [Alicyclobacillus sp.]|nr:flagellin [Alicyclobacillus sp.]
MNALAALNQNQNSLQKVLQQLSTGKRINGASDDAAGLAISQKMQGQINGLDQASRNAQDGISLIQTAEGALNETQSILQRMRQLAVQAANDTNTTTDRQSIQDEMNQLSQELSRIGDTTEFNTQKLLNGNFTGTFQIGANQDQNLTVAISDMRGYALGMAGSASYSETGTVTAGSTSSLADGTYSVTTDGTNYYLVDQNGNKVATSTDGLTFTNNADNTNTIVFSGDKITSGNVTISGTSATGTAYVQNNGLQAGTYTVSGTKVLNASGVQIGTYDSTTKTVKDLTTGTTLATFGNDISGKTFTVGGIDITSQAAANKAITTIQNAIDKVSTQRSELGAYQNRLEHTINNLSTSSQNLTTAESGITDTNMASAMAEFTKDNVLQQAAVSMLAQANQQPQLVLKLLG